MRHIPNLICLFRVVLIVPLLQAMLAGDQARILILFTVAAVSDGLDGYLAKRFGWTSELGRFLDPAADKLLLVSVFIVAAWLGIAPWWVAAIAAARDLVIAGGALIFRLWFGPVRGRPSIISKINTGVQISYLLAVILASAVGLPPREMLDALAVVVLLTTLASGADYVILFVRRAIEHTAATGTDHQRMKQIPLGVRLQDRTVFNSFLPGDNGLALSSLQRMAQGSIERRVYLHGPAGSGKSHLLQSLCAAISGSAYFPLAQLLASGPEVLDGADQLSAVALDDLHLVTGDKAWERRLFNFYNDCESRGTRLAIAAAAPAAGLDIELPDLRSRLSSMTHFALRLLDEAQQREALQLRAAQRGLELPDETVRYLQRRFARDMSTMQALLDRLDAASLEEQRRITVPFIRQVTGDRT